jgi:hypothetical protein
LVIGRFSNRFLPFPAPYAAVRDKFLHDLLVQPDIHSRYVTCVAGVFQFFREFFSRDQAVLDIGGQRKEVFTLSARAGRKRVTRRQPPEQSRRARFRDESRRDFLLSSEYSLRRHIRRECRRGSEDL